MPNDLIKAYAQEVVVSPLCSLYMSKTWLIKAHHTGYEIIFNYFVTYKRLLNPLQKIEGYFCAIFATKHAKTAVRLCNLDG